MRIAALGLKSWIRSIKSRVPLIILSAVSMALLCGSFMVGFSVEQSLKNIGYDRLGKARYLISPPAGIAADFAAALSALPGNNAALTAATAVQVNAGGLSLTNVKVYGINNDFFQLYSQDLIVPGKNEIIINSHLADKMNLETGMDLIINLKNDPLIPVEIPLGEGEYTKIILTMTIVHIIDNHGAGNFSLNIGSDIDDIIYMNHTQLSEKLERDSRFSMVLLENLPEQNMDIWIREHWGLEDLSLFQTGYSNYTELRSSYLFISQTISDNLPESMEFELISSGFIISAGGPSGSTPYSFFTSRTDLQGGIIIGRWLAEDTGLTPGDFADIKWWSAGENSRLKEEQISIKVLSILEDDIMAEYRYQLPEFPGLTSSESCRLWDSGIPLDLTLIRDKDEDWWNKRGASPRIIFPLEIAEKINNSFSGSVTGIRFNKSYSTAYENELLASINPSELGYIPKDMYNAIERGGSEGVDFSGLFTGLSFFLILSCAYLLYRSQVLAVEQKKDEIKTLKALGFNRKKLYLWFMIQFTSGVGIALIPGIILAVLYQRFIITSLNSIWSGAVAGTTLSVNWNYNLMGAGLLSACFLSLLCVFLALYKSVRKRNIVKTGSGSFHFPAVITGIISGIAAIFFLILFYFNNQNKGLLFFASGISLILFCFSLFEIYYINRISNPLSDIFHLAIHESKRHYSFIRSQFLFYSCSLFLLLTLALPFGTNPDNSSGTGGFIQYIETAMPVPSNNAIINLPGENTQIIGLRKQDGDDASCLNLNRVFQPSVLGVSSALLEGNSVFHFAKSLNGEKTRNVWPLLAEIREDGRIPAFADKTVLTWNLKLEVGDSFIIKDNNGKDRELVIAAALSSSIFQGHIIIEESFFRDLFPLSGGYKILLTKNNSNPEALERIVQPWGGIIESTENRLHRFAEVEQNYLKIFVNLGLAALILGSLGTGFHLIAKIRNSSKFWALLSAIGYSEKQRKSWLFYQSAPPLFLALLTSAVSVLIPMLIWSFSSGIRLSWIWVAIVYSALVLFVYICLTAVFRLLLKTPYLSSLRNE